MDDTTVHGLAYLKAEVDALRNEVREIRAKQDEVATQQAYIIHLCLVSLHHLNLLLRNPI